MGGWSTEDLVCGVFAPTGPEQPDAYLRVRDVPAHSHSTAHFPTSGYVIYSVRLACDAQKRRGRRKSRLQDSSLQVHVSQYLTTRQPAVARALPLWAAISADFAYWNRTPIDYHRGIPLNHLERNIMSKHSGSVESVRRHGQIAPRSPSASRHGGSASRAWNTVGCSPRWA